MHMAYTETSRALRGHTHPLVGISWPAETATSPLVKHCQPELGSSGTSNVSRISETAIVNSMTGQGGGQHQKWSRPRQNKCTLPHCASNSQSRPKLPILQVHGNGGSWLHTPRPLQTVGSVLALPLQTNGASVTSTCCASGRKFNRSTTERAARQTQLFRQYRLAHINSAILWAYLKGCSTGFLAICILKDNLDIMCTNRKASWSYSGPHRHSFSSVLLIQICVKGNACGRCSALDHKIKWILGYHTGTCRFGGKAHTRQH